MTPFKLGLWIGGVVGVWGLLFISYWMDDKPRFIEAVILFMLLRIQINQES